MRIDSAATGVSHSTWAAQYGPTIGNLALTLAGLLLLVVVFMWIDQLMNYFRLSGWKLFIVKNGLRLILLFIISLPLIGFNVKPTVTIAYTHAHPYEAGKKVEIDLYITNKNTAEKLIKGTYRVFVSTPAGKSRQELEDELWAILMTTDERKFIEFPVALPNTHPRVVMEGPVLTSEQVNGLRDQNTVVYFVGVLLYYEWYGLPRRIEFCGHYLDDIRFMIMCNKHSNWFSRSADLRPQ